MTKRGAMKVLICPDTERHLLLLEKHLRQEGVDVVFFKWFGRFTPYWLCRLLWLRLRGYDILNIHWIPFDGLLRMRIGKLACKALGYRMVLTVHNLAPHDVRFGNESKDRGAMAFLAAWADAIIVHCERTKDDFIQWYGNPSSPIYVSDLANYIETLQTCDDPSNARQKLGLPEDRILVFILAPCREDKGLGTYLNVVSSLSEGYVGVVAGSCGDAEMKESIEKKSAENPGKFIVRLGRLSDSALADYYAAIDIIFIPYKSNTTSGSVMEAISYGKAVVAPPLGNIPVLVHDGINGYLASTPEEAISRIELIDRTTAKKMGDESLQIAKRFTWDDVAREYIEAFKQVRSD